MLNQNSNLDRKKPLWVVLNYSTWPHLKRNLNFRRLRVRGMTGARDECTLAAIAQNLRKLAKLIGFAQRPPLAAACVS
jgi:hypothetical protein